MSGVRRLARLAAYYLMHATILLGATMLWGSYAILVAVHPAWRRKTAKFLRLSDVHTHQHIDTTYHFSHVVKRTCTQSSHYPKQQNMSKNTSDFGRIY